MKWKKHKREFAENVFDDGKMKKYLPKCTYEAIVAARQNFTELSQQDRDVYANAVCKWALKRGVTRFTHWFQPLNNYTAEKRDCLYSIDKQRNIVVKFRGKELSNGEGDASSFPNGGIRQTFEARGITQWDCTSYPFVKDGCLCVPCTFTSYNGEVLDKKTPLLNSCKVLNLQAMRVLKNLGDKATRVYSVVGAEQEYFLVDKNLYQQRKDLVYTGRTLFGARPPKGQEFDDHYFRPPNDKIATFMRTVDRELWKLGIVVKTEHNEVAPHQCELAPCYTHANLACDYNQLTMETLKRVADEQGLTCLLHEKPFAYVNGSGKHNNWSLLTDEDENLLEIGTTPYQNARFLLMLAAVVKAVDDYSDLLLTSVCSAGNDCRLGGYEAPPQILTVFLGGPLCKAITYATSGKWKCGRDLLPAVLLGTDRNRTSPFAFTGNKFEFRMVGSSSSISDVNTLLNTAVAESLRQFADTLDNSANTWDCVLQLITETFVKHKRVLFDGNNYSPSWAEEAKQRNLKSASTVACVESLSNARNMNVLERHNVLSYRETLARQQVLLCNYVNTVKVEGNVAVEIYRKQICPAVEGYLNKLTELAKNKIDLNITCETEKDKIEKITKLLRHCKQKCSTLHRHLIKTDVIDTLLQKAHYCETYVVNAMNELRQQVDKLEQLCPDSVWPLPTYGQMLFDEEK